MTFPFGASAPCRWPRGGPGGERRHGASDEAAPGAERRPPRRRPRPAAPAAPAGPVKLDLKPMQAPWTKICGKDQASSKEVCYTTRDFGQAADQPPTLAIAVYQMSGEESRIARFLLPVGLLLRPGFRLVIDKGEPIEGKFAICFPNGCFAEAELNGKTIGDLKKAQIASVIVRNQANIEVTFNLPMKDFGAAFDGPAGRSEGARAAESGAAEAARGAGAASSARSSSSSSRTARRRSRRRPRPRRRPNNRSFAAAAARAPVRTPARRRRAIGATPA